jgi:hypothetical protein
MPKLNDMFPSKYLKAADIDQDYEVEISQVTKETLGQGDDKEDKFIVHFSEFDKGLVLNKTNANLIAAQHGDDTEGWLGRKVVLTVEDVAYQGKIQPAIRIKRPARPVAPPRRAGAPAPVRRPANEQEAADEAADDGVKF